MNYALQYTAEARDRLDLIPPEVIGAVFDHLERLADDPLKHGRKGVFPFPGKFQIFDFDVCTFDATHYFTAFFNFVPGEESLLVSHINHRECPGGLINYQAEDDPPPDIE